jgi:creatinine amidohydrolase
MKRLSRREFIRDAGVAGLGVAAVGALAQPGASAAEKEPAVEEVRYELLQPDEMIARRDKCPVAYIGIGTLEWHDEQNPLGLDALKADGLVRECARRGGGVVFPPLFYGESRTEAHVDPTVAEHYGLPKENFTYFCPYTVAQQWEHYQHLLISIFNEMASLGFRFIIVCAGHFPLNDHAKAAMAVFRQTARRHPTQPVTGYVFTGCELVLDKFPKAGDHAGPWETSLMMAVNRDSVDLAKVPQERKDSIKDFSQDYGRKAIDAIADRVLERVRDMLANPGKYLGHMNPV